MSRCVCEINDRDELVKVCGVHGRAVRDAVARERKKWQELVAALRPCVIDLLSWIPDAEAALRDRQDEDAARQIRDLASSVRANMREIKEGRP